MHESVKEQHEVRMKRGKGRKIELLRTGYKMFVMILYVKEIGVNTMLSYDITGIGLYEVHLCY